MLAISKVFFYMGFGCQFDYNHSFELNPLKKNSCQGHEDDELEGRKGWREVEEG